MKKTLLSTTLGAAFLGCATAPPPPPPKVVAPPPKVETAKKADPLEEGNAQFQKGSYDEAMKAYSSVLAADPKSETAAYNKAVTLQKMGKLDEAVQAYNAFLAEHPDHADATLNLGAIYRSQGKQAEGIALYNKFLKKDAYNSKILNNLVVLYRDKKDYKSAIDRVRTLLMRDQKNIDAYKNLALVYYDQGKYKLAQTILANALRMAKEQNVNDPDIHVNFGLTHLALGDKGKAMLSFKKAVEIDPKHVLANYNIGALALGHRDYELAAHSYEVVQKAWPTDPDVIAALGYSYQGQQKFAEAAKELEKAKAMKPNDEPVVYQLMVVWQAANEPEKALGYGKEILKVQNKVCKEDEFEGICGRIKGIEAMIKAKNAPAPKEDDKKPKATGKGAELFKDAPAEGDEAAAGGAAAPDAAAAPKDDKAEGADKPK
ncbi:MAG: tetratricopeptide repeat protein [Myxococcota bacterium]